MIIYFTYCMSRLYPPFVFLSVKWQKMWNCLLLFPGARCDIFKCPAVQTNDPKSKYIQFTLNLKLKQSQGFTAPGFGGRTAFVQSGTTINTNSNFCLAAPNLSCYIGYWVMQSLQLYFVTMNGNDYIHPLKCLTFVVLTCIVCHKRRISWLEKE